MKIVFDLPQPDDLGPLEPAFESFVELLRERLAKGAREYGDASLDRPPGELLDEIEEELIDISGWSVVLLNRLRRIRAAIERIEHPPATTDHD